MRWFFFFVSHTFNGEADAQQDIPAEKANADNKGECFRKGKIIYFALRFAGRAVGFSLFWFFTIEG